MESPNNAIYAIIVGFIMSQFPVYAVKINFFESFFSHNVYLHGYNLLMQFLSVITLYTFVQAGKSTCQDL